MRAIDSDDHFTENEVATMLGKHPVSLRKWRKRNKELGRIVFGPPYEKVGPNIGYPKEAFRAWVIEVQVVNGVPQLNAANVKELPHAA